MKVYEQLLSDNNLQRCSIEAKGLFVMIVSYILQNDGKFIISGSAVKPKSIGVVSGCEGMGKQLQELIDQNVLFNNKGVLTSTVIHHHNSIREIRRLAGQKGGNPKLQKKVRKVKKESLYDKYPELLENLVFSKDHLAHIRLAKKMHTTWRKIFPESLTLKRAKVKGWAEECRLMHDIDKRRNKDIWKIFEWVIVDTKFWATTISSPKGLRSNYDTIMQSMIKQEDTQTGTIKKQDNYLEGEEQ